VIVRAYGCFLIGRSDTSKRGSRDSRKAGSVIQCCA